MSDRMNYYRDGNTGFSRKQAGVIYSASKRGNIKVSQDTMSLIYDFIDGPTTDSKTADLNCALLQAVGAIFASDYDAAQQAVEAFETGFKIYFEKIA